MAARHTRSRWALMALSGVLAASVALNVALLVTSASGPTVVAVSREGHDRTPRVLVDFDAPVATDATVGDTLREGLVRLKPAVPITARFLSTRRLEIRPTRRLPRFTHYVIVLGGGLADPEGRPVQGGDDVDLSFVTGVFGLRDDVRTWVDERGRAVAAFELRGPVRAGALTEHLALLDEAGTALDYDLQGSGDEWRAVLDTVPEGQVRLRLARGLASTQGPIGLAQDVLRPLVWSGAFVIEDVDVATATDGATITLSFSRVLADVDPLPFVTVSTPPDDLKVRRDDSCLHIHGSFEAGRLVKIEVRNGLPALDGSTLESRATRTVVVPAPEPDLGIAQAGQVLSAAARPTIHVKGINVSHVDVALHEVFPTNVVPLALRWQRAPRLAAPAVETRIEIDSPPHEPWNEEIDLEALLGRRPRGAYLVAVSDPDTWARDTQLLQITDLAPVVRLRPEGAVVFVSRLSDGTPVPAADVTLYDKTNQVRGRGVTDDDGLALLDDVDGDPQVLVVKTADDLAWVDLRAHALGHAPRDIEGREPARALEVFAYADRGVVRPGEIAHLGILVRTAAGAPAPADLPLRFTLRDQHGRGVRTLSRRTNVHGMARLEVPFDLDAPTGPYALDVRLPGDETPSGSVAFRVASIVPDRIEVRVTPPDGPLALGESVPVALAAQRLTGEPAAGLEARLRVRYRPLAASENDGLTFGDASQAPSPFTVELATLDLDGEGLAHADVELPEPGTGGLALEATFELEVVDVSGRACFARTTRRVDPAGPRLGVRAPHGSAFAASVVLRGDGPDVATATLERLRWRGSWVVERGRARWRATRRSEVVATSPVRLADGRGVATLPDPGDGTWRLRVEAEGCASAAVTFERWDGTTHGVVKGTGSPRLDLRLETPQVAPGDAAVLRVDAPFAGRALLTLEGPGVLEARCVNLVEGHNGLEIVVPDALAPNLYATCTLVRGAQDAGERPARFVGAVSIPIFRPERHLEVSLDVPDDARPGTTVDVVVRTDAPATVALHLVDEGVLRLTGHASPQPTAHFEGRRRLETRLADLFSSLLTGQRFEDDPEPGGGGVLASRLDPTARKTIETVALASTLVACDGEATVSFDLPAWEGRLRVFAIAASTAGTGAAETPWVVRDLVSVTAHLPRAAAPGDVFDVRVETRGEDVRWTADLDGLEQVATLPEGRGLRVRALERPGVASVTITARDAHGHETVRTGRLSIRPPAPFTVRHRVLHLPAGTARENLLTGRWLAGHRRARLTVGRPGPLELLPSLERLLEYPHGCVEQTVSGAFPTLAWAELARLAHPEQGRPADVVEAAIDRLQLMRVPGGGLATWPGGRTTYEWGTAYAAHFLVEARRLGREVPEALVDGVLNHLEGRLRAGVGTPYAARVLALGGRAVASWLDTLAASAEDDEARADLAAAYLLTGNRLRAEALLEDVGDPWTAAREQGGRLSSPVRAAATVLGALAEARPDDARIPELLLRLHAAATTTTTSWTTQDQAAALLALAKAYRAPTPGARGTLEAGGVKHAYADTPLTVEIGPDDPWTLSLRAETDTVAVLRVEGIPLDTEAQAPVVEGMHIKRWIEAPDGPLVSGHVYRVVVEGVVPPGAENLLVTDVLPGGLEIESAPLRTGRLHPDRVEARDDRVLAFRTPPLSGGFTWSYWVRAVTPGHWRVPAVQAELLYDPTTRARGESGRVLEVARP